MRHSEDEVAAVGGGGRVRVLHAGRTGKEGEETGGDAPRFTAGFLFLRTPAPVSLRERGEMDAMDTVFFSIVIT